MHQAGFEPTIPATNHPEDLHFTPRVHCDHRLCGLVVSVADYKHRGPGFDFWALLRIFLRELGLERDPLSLVIG
jgi:hypothetical protein